MIFVIRAAFRRPFGRLIPARRRGNDLVDQFARCIRAAFLSWHYLSTGTREGQSSQRDRERERERSPRHNCTVERSLLFIDL
jgi:hypothetical protein